jgi:hypothetical protein
MKVRVYFCREIDPQAILKGNKISEQALNTIYELVWECEFKSTKRVTLVADAVGVSVDSMYLMSRYCFFS